MPRPPTALKGKHNYDNDGPGKLLEGKIHTSDLMAITGHSTFKLKKNSVHGWKRTGDGYWLISSIAPTLGKALDLLNGAGKTGVTPAPKSADELDAAHQLARQRKAAADKAEGLLIERGVAQQAIRNTLASFKTRVRSVPSQVSNRHPEVDPAICATVQALLDEALTDTYSAMAAQATQQED